MRTSKEILAMLDQAVDRSNQKTKFPGMTYEEGVRAALEWVDGDDDPLEE